MIDIAANFRETAGLLQRLASDFVPQVEAGAQLMSETLRAGGKVLFCGNGGSAADSQHLATELVVRLSAAFPRRALGGLALTTDSSALTACANDFSFEQIFARQVEAIGREGDCLVAISTSGNSANVLAAVRVARERGIRVLGLLGGDGGSLAAECDLALIVPARDPGRVQECHIALGHNLIALAEREVC